jgi:hypothetical protein
MVADHVRFGVVIPIQSDSPWFPTGDQAGGRQGLAKNRSPSPQAKQPGQKMTPQIWHSGIAETIARTFPFSNWKLLLADGWM